MVRLAKNGRADKVCLVRLAKKGRAVDTVGQARKDDACLDQQVELAMIPDFYEKYEKP